MKFKFDKKKKYLAMLAPSFVVDFNYPEVISQLRELGFDKVVELTFGAKMVNRCYHEKLKNSKELVIASVCPGIVESVRERFPEYVRNLIKVDSPMIAMAKICRKTYPNHKIVFISPCNFKKTEARKSKYIDFVIDYKELAVLLQVHKVRGKKKDCFDKFYNEYTRIYPIAGGLSKTAHLLGVLNKKEARVIDGILDVEKFLKKPNKKIRFLDATFCKGGCIGGQCVSSKLSLAGRKKKVLDYLKLALNEEIPRGKRGKINRAKGICFEIKTRASKTSIFDSHQKPKVSEIFDPIK